MAAPVTRVLVAVSQSGYGIAKKLLRGCDADIVTDFEQGTRALARTSYAYVLVGMLFAESHMFEFVQEVKRHQPGARVLGVRGVGAPLTDQARSGLQAALQTGAASAARDARALLARMHER